mgnify:FL=1
MRTNKVDWEQGKRLRLRGESLRSIARTLGCNVSTVSRKADRDSWDTAENVLQRVATGAPTLPVVESVKGENRSSDVKARIQADIETVLDALQTIDPAELSLAQLATRERIAESVQKRAGNAFDIEDKDKPIVNIAVLSQLVQQ